MASWPNNVGQGNFLPNALDFTSLDTNSQEFRVKLYQSLNQIILAVNQKSSGLYQFEETVDNNLWAPDPLSVSSTAAQTAIQQAEFRKAFTMPALVNGGTIELLHGITFDSTTTFVNIYGSATDPINFFSIGLGYASTIGNNAELWLDATKIYIRTSGPFWQPLRPWSGFTKVRAIVAFLKQ